MEHEGGDDLGYGAPEVGVAAEVRIRLSAEVWDEPPRVHHEEGEGAERGDHPPPPAPLRHGQPQPEAHHGDGRILARGEDEEHGGPVQRPLLRLHEVDGGEEERDGEGSRVEVAHVDAVQRRMDQIEHGEYRGRTLITQPPRRDAEDGDSTQGQRYGLRGEEDAGAGSYPEGGHEQVHDR